MDKWFKPKTEEQIHTQADAVHSFRHIRPEIGEDGSDLEILRKIRKEGLKDEILVEEYVGSIIEEMVIGGEFVGSGYDGIVLKFDSRQLNEEEAHFIKENGIGIEEDVAALKILKVYQPLAGELEFKAQKIASNILNNNPELASVPEVLALKDIKIHEEAKSRLTSRGASLDDEAEIILMDYIDGRDMSTIFYDYVLSKSGFDEDFLKDMTFSQKYSEVANLLNFSMPEDITKRNIQITLQNEEKLVAFLMKNNFPLDRQVIEKLEKSLEALRENGIFHNDLHGRNIMIDKDGKVFIIDFGRATIGDKKPGTNTDILFLDKWKKLAGIENTREKQQDSNRLLELENLVSKHQRFLDLKNRLSKNLTDRTLRNTWSQFSTSDATTDLFFITLRHLLSINDTNKAIIGSFIEKLTDIPMAPNLKNKIVNLINEGYFD